jgi:hypothetical protein
MSASSIERYAAGLLGLLSCGTDPSASLYIDQLLSIL